MRASHSRGFPIKAWITRVMLPAAGLLVWTASSLTPDMSAEPTVRHDKQGSAVQIEAAKPKPEPLMSLSIVGAKDAVVAREVPTGWPLTFRLTSNGELGIGRPFVTPYFPQFEDLGFIVFADPDGCPSFDAINAPCPGGVDETMLEFWPDMDRAGVSNPHGNVERLIALTESGGGGSPKVLTFDNNSGLNNLLVRYGPYVGSGDTLAFRCVGGRLAVYPGSPCVSDADCDNGTTCRQVPLDADGFGYGADDDLPGLALFSDTGVGLVLDQDFNAGQPRLSRNLAGLVHSVAYELNDATSKTSVLVHLNVPGSRTVTLPQADPFIPASSPLGLFTPAILADFCIGDPQTCNSFGAGLVRIDGGSPTAMTVEEVAGYLNSRVVTLRAFVVNGTAPSVLADLNGDGVVGAKDAQQAGYTLLSGEKTFRIVSFYDGELFDLFLPYDFDGNGKTLGAVASPKGPGGITIVPR